jgi:rod shape-determining protein MreD
MKPLLYLALAVGLVPVQTTVLEHLSLAGIRPDLCLVAVSAIGLFGGITDGVAMGLLLGLQQDLFSAGEGWTNAVAKAVIGLAAGIAGHYLARATPVSAVPVLAGLSIASGAAFLLAGAGRHEELLPVAQAVLLPQAAFDTVLGIALYWVLAEKFLKRDDSLV